ncbi:hypothetical protein BLOT_000039 [Blomia tropicalis]|nr:hypothetical protein BLOT_000039 [Blomia tropicalis]
MFLFSLVVNLSRIVYTNKISKIGINFFFVDKSSTYSIMHACFVYPVNKSIVIGYCMMNICSYGSEYNTQKRVTLDKIHLVMKRPFGARHCCESGEPISGESEQWTCIYSGASSLSSSSSSYTILNCIRIHCSMFTINHSFIHLFIWYTFLMSHFSSRSHSMMLILDEH